MIDPDTYIRSTIEPGSSEDMRQPDVDETPLSPQEVAAGINDGTIPPGPIASRIVDVYVLQRRRVEITQLPNEAA